MGVKDKGESLYHIVWDPFQSVARSWYQVKTSVLGGEGAHLLIDCKRFNEADGVGDANRPGTCACMGQAEWAKTTVTPIDMVVHTMGCHFRK